VSDFVLPFNWDDITFNASAPIAGTETTTRPGIGRQGKEMKMTDTVEILDIGRGAIKSKLVFTGEVAGGGAVGPGRVYKFVDYNRTVTARFERDNRSGSKRSGSCVWQLEADALYQLDDIAISSRDSSTFYVSTFGGVPVRLTKDEFNAERARIWPLGKIEVEAEAERRRQAEAERIKRDNEIAEQRRIESEALKELNEERAAEIAEKGQEKVEGLPELTGTSKQIAYALNIRAAYAVKHPGDAALKRGTTAKYWIENHRSILFNR